MKLLQHLYASVRALLIAAISTTTVSAQQEEFVDQEEEEWRAAVEEGTAAAFQRYLESYPTGRYADEAFGCAVELGVSEQCTLLGGGDDEPVRYLRGIGPAADMY